MFILLILIAACADYYEIFNESLSSSSITSGAFARPSTQQIWERIYGRMLKLHPELAAMPPLTYPQLMEKQNEILSTVAIRGSQEKLTRVPQDNHTEGRYQQQMLKKEHLANAAGTPRQSAEHLRPLLVNRDSHVFRIVRHDPSCSLLSVRLPSINERSISPSGREALKKLREEIRATIKFN